MERNRGRRHRASVLPAGALADNAAGGHGTDGAALPPVVGKIGPTVAETAVLIDVEPDHQSPAL